jgi:predicted CXXCH cytochrome family protein
MVFWTSLLVFFLLAALIVLQVRRALGRENTMIGVTGVLLLGGGWAALEWGHRIDSPPADPRGSPPATSQACVKCHAGHYASWQRSYHRTMTREATPEFVKAVFDGTPLHHLGVTSRMIRRGDRYLMDTVDPSWLAEQARQGTASPPAETAPRRELSIDRIVGSHWFQQMLHRDEEGRYIRLPLMYHLVEGRWIHVDGAFINPDGAHFFSRAANWNETCLYCHNTRPSMNPVPLFGQASGYRTEVAELGIACEACHGPGERHIQAHHNPARRLAQRYGGEPDPTIVNPARLPIARADQICGRCHAGAMPRREIWDQNSFTDPFIAGQELTQSWHLMFSEAEMRLAENGVPLPTAIPRLVSPEPLDGRYWSDGTPLTTALEYQGMVLSACYQGGQGKMSCLSCHAMHGNEPNHQVRDGMRTNAACYGCHEGYRERLVAHTHHPADSPGSLCANCHMPYQVYSLLDTHRSHRIGVPRVKDSLGTGKPHACNLCHLDKSLGWTQERLGQWYGTKPEPLADDEQRFAAGLLHLLRDDARSRVVVAGAFGWPPAQQAAGREWAGPLLAYTLEHDRYQAVRYLAHRALRSLHGDAVRDYNYQGSAAERTEQLRRLRLTLAGLARPDPSRYPYLPLTAAGRMADNVLDRLLRARNDPDVTINE